MHGSIHTTHTTHVGPTMASDACFYTPIFFPLLFPHFTSLPLLFVLVHLSNLVYRTYGVSNEKMKN
jgi:hypothetical protein